MAVSLGGIVLDYVGGAAAVGAAGTIGEGVVGGALIGAGMSAVTGGNVGQGALMGAVGGGIGGAISGSGAAAMSSNPNNYSVVGDQLYDSSGNTWMGSIGGDGQVIASNGTQIGTYTNGALQLDSGAISTMNAGLATSTGAAGGVNNVMGTNLTNSQLAAGAKGLLSIVNGASGNQAMTTAQAQTMADPFSSSRQTYVGQLNSLMANPSLTMSQPGYQFQMQQGAQQLQAQLAQTGQSNAGAAGAALQRYGQNYATNAYQTYFNQLAQLSGANQSPSAGASAALSAQQQKYNQQSAYDTALSQGIGALGQAFGGNKQSGGTPGIAGPVYNTPTVTSNTASPNMNDLYNSYIQSPVTSPDTSGIDWLSFAG